MFDPHSRIQRMLRVPKELIDSLESSMNLATGKTGVRAELESDIDQMLTNRLERLGLNRNASSEEVYANLLALTEQTNTALQEIFSHPQFDTAEGCKNMLDETHKLSGVHKGFFLKKEKAIEFLHLNPPQNVLKETGYPNVDSLLAKENLWDVYASLRFAESMQWLNSVFLRSYEDLTADDFEEREITVHVLGKEWAAMGRKYVGHKLHNISHLKELGVIFVLPYEEQKDGETIQIFTLVLHYLHEVDFYSGLFKHFSEEKEFTKYLTSALRGDIFGLAMTDHGQAMWRIVQRYLAKDDANDPRLFEPHVNPEAIHWLKGERDIEKLAQKFQEHGVDISFWKDLDYVGAYFPSKSLKRDVLVSFDLIDNTISFVKKSDIESKYLYHQQEALWNEFFMRYVGEEKTEEVLRKHFTRGFLKIPEDLQK